jgi:ornithine--oxo-acid transaminase
MKDSDYWTRLHKEGIQSIVSGLTSQQADMLIEKFGTHNYHPLPLNVTRTENARVFDRDGREYIDCIGAYSAVAHGHLNPFIVETLRAQLNISALTSRAVNTPELALFLEGLCRFTEMDMGCPMNTGAEAVETAIKLARKWGYTKKNIRTDYAEIIVASGNFHGRTTTIVGFSSEPAYKNNFGPFSAGFTTIPFGDIDALRSAINGNTAAVLLEPIQAESGILIPPEGYMKAVRDTCSEENVLLIWDEIQTGFGRTGKTFAWQHEDAKPDMICLGKALGGGLIPVSAVAGRADVMNVFQPGDHGSTFGGSPLACTVALAAIAELEVNNLAERSRVLGDRLLGKFREIRSPGIVEVRGRGLLIGLEVTPDVDSAELIDAFLECGILTKETRHHTFRFAPPLTIDDDTVGQIALGVESALDRIS